MRRTMIAAALFGAAFSGETVQAQEWGGAAGVSAMRGYTASPGVRMTSYDAGPSPAAAQPPADAEAKAQPSIDEGASAAVAVADVAQRHRRSAAGRAVPARPGHGRHHRHRHTA